MRDQRHTENVCARDRDEAESVDLADEVDLFSAGSLGNVRMKGSSDTFYAIDQKHVDYIHYIHQLLRNPRRHRRDLAGIHGRNVECPLR
jgi:hypothetical protein